MKEIVIWAHSECRSNAALYAEVKRLAEEDGLRVTMCLWDMMPMDESRKVHGLQWIRVGDDLAKGREILAVHGGKDVAHVFCVYQNSSVWRQFIVEAKRGGARVVVSAEAPCPMCVGLKAWVKKLYYRLVLPWKVRGVVKAADLFLNASGMNGLDGLVRLGWDRERIVPFGYASDCSSNHETTFAKATAIKIHKTHENGCLRVLHTGIETPYRGVATLRRAVDMVRGKGIAVDLTCTKGEVSEEEMTRLYGWADVFVACGRCEPWGIRVNDAIHAGLPVVVSDGMGVRWLVDQFGCGCVFPAGDDVALAKILERFAKDGNFRERLNSGVVAAHKAWTPEARARVWLDKVMGS